MIRLLRILNVIGIFALAALCGVQWRIDRRLNLEISRLQASDLEQSARIQEREDAIRRLTSDADDLRHRVNLSEAALKESGERFKSISAERDQLESDRDQLKTTLKAWMAAVAERDAALNDTSAQNIKLASERNDAISKFNDLAGKFNAMVEMAKKGIKK